MARRARSDDLDSAAKAASDAARTLQARGQEKKAEIQDPKPAPADLQELDPGHVAKALKQRPSSRAMDELYEQLEPKDEEVKAEDPPKEEPKPEEAKVEAKPEPELKAEVLDAPPIVEAPKMVKVKIDGEESEVSQEDVDAYGGVRAYQIAKAAENRLAKMNETLAEMKRSQAEALTKKEPEKPSVSDQQFIAERMEKIRFGTPEEAAQAQLEIHQRLYKPVNPQEIEDRAAARIRHDAAVAKFDAEFDDLAKNPVLLKAVVAIRNERIQQLPKGTPVDWEKFYRTIGNEVRTAVGRPHQSATQSEKTQSITSSASKEEKKAASSTVVALPAAGNARAAPPKEEKELTPEEERDKWLSDTKKARGR